MRAPSPDGPPPGHRRPGRPKGSKNKAIADIRALAQSYGPDAIDRLNEIMNDREAPPNAQVAAARELLDRGFGRPTQFVAQDPTENPLFDMGKVNIDWASMPKDVLQAALAAARSGLDKDQGDDETDGD